MIPISKIDKDAACVINRLTRAGYTAYLVGGGVRDLLLDIPPKDFDVVTNATPREIKRLFRNAFLIGRRFRLALIKFGDKQIETATFRSIASSVEISPDKEPPAVKNESPEEMPRDRRRHGREPFHDTETEYSSSPEEDANRRDFTVNALFYDLKTGEVIDFVGGVRDIKKKILRSIGDPNVRFVEDPVRMMRAVRFAAKLGFKINWPSSWSIHRHCMKLRDIPAARLFDEVLKLFPVTGEMPRPQTLPGRRRRGRAPKLDRQEMIPSCTCIPGVFKLLWKYGLLEALLPKVHEYVEASGKSRSPLWANLDELVNRSQAECLATLIGPALALEMRGLDGHETKKRGFPVRIDPAAVSEMLFMGTGGWRPPRRLCCEIADICGALADSAE